MVFISKNRNFTSKTRFSTVNNLEMPFYSGKYGYYPEKQKFLPRKRCFLVKKNYKCRFTLENMVIIRQNINFTSKTMFSSEKTL